MAGLVGFIARVISATRSSDEGAPRVIIKADRDGVDTLTFEQLTAPGDDSPPLPADYVGAFPAEGTGRFVSGGFTDPINAGVAENGEKRIYGRDPAGVVVNALHLKGDGSIEITQVNGIGSILMAPDGTVTINGATITPAGDVISKKGTSLDNHLTSAGAFMDSVPAPVTGISGPPVL